MTPERKKAIRERLEKATPGPWHAWRNPYRDDDGHFVTQDEPGGELRRRPIARSQMARGDAYFIAAAPEDIRDLLAYVESLEDAIWAWCAVPLEQGCLCHCCKVRREIHAGIPADEHMAELDGSRSDE